MSTHTHPRPPALDLTRPLIGLVLLAFGVVFLLDAAGALDGDEAVDRWWPLILVVAGLFQLAEHRRSHILPLTLIGSGAALLLFTTDVVEGDPGPYIGPAALIAVGLVVLGRWRARRSPGASSADDVLRVEGIFGGPQVATTSQLFRAATLTAVFGGVTLDLRQARPGPGGATVSATAAFGGIDVIVPRGWRVSVSGTPIFGGIGDKTDRSVTPEPDAPQLDIDALAIFGGVEVKHEK
jgi:hypothetical protein